MSPISAPPSSIHVGLPGETATPPGGPLVAASGQDLEVECVAGQLRLLFFSKYIFLNLSLFVYIPLSFYISLCFQISFFISSFLSISLYFYSLFLYTFSLVRMPFLTPRVSIVDDHSLSSSYD
jgi:hypothetical protein